MRDWRRPIAVRHCLLPVIALLVGAILAIDLLTPRLFLAAAFYVVPVLLAASTQSRRTTYVVAIACTVAATVGFGVWAVWNHSAMPMSYYLCAVILVWATVIAVLQKKRTANMLNQDGERREPEVSEQATEISATNQRLRQEIAERKRVADELWRSNMELQELAYVAAHDLKQPLQTAMLFLQLLDQRFKTELSCEGQEVLGHALNSTRRMDNLIDDLLELACLEKNQPTCEPVCAQCALDEALSILRAVIQRNGASVSHDVLPAVTADRRQLVQLFQNLVGNAIKYRGHHRPMIHVGATERKEEFQFSVRDNGIGIDLEHAGDIFKAFHRLHSDVPGTGIGLSLCQQIVGNHGGRIWVESRPNQGSTFYFTLAKSLNSQSVSTDLGRP